METPARIERTRDTVRCTGSWTASGLGDVEKALHRIARPRGHAIVFDLAGLERMDLTGAWLLARTAQHLERQDFAVELTGAAAEHMSLIEMVEAQAQSAATIPEEEVPGFLERLGREAAEMLETTTAFLAFIGRLTVIAVRIILTPATLRWSRVVREIEISGFDALPIVGLLTFLVGVVIAYQGGVLLREYGGSVFIADLVGFSVLRELSPLITAIIVAGRTGSAYTAEIGTMKVTEEVDALRSIGITPLEMLALPKLVGLVIALPLLTVFADIMGLLGGMVVARFLLDLSYISFMQRFVEAIDLSSYLVGIGKAPVFAGIIASVGCYQGFQVTGSAESVGERTTMSVVQSIFLVIVVDAVLSVIFNELEI